MCHILQEAYGLSMLVYSSTMVLTVPLSPPCILLLQATQAAAQINIKVLSFAVESFASRPCPCMLCPAADPSYADVSLLGQLRSLHMLLGCTSSGADFMHRLWGQTLR